METVLGETVPVPSFGVQIPLRPEVIIDIDDAKQILSDRENAALVSVRTWREHIGAVSGYNYIGPAGRIAGDVWGNCGSDAYHMQHYRSVDNTMRAYPEIAANWEAAGNTADKWVAFYCGTGWRAGETCFYAHLMDWPRIDVHDGRGFEWGRARRVSHRGRGRCVRGGHGALTEERSQRRSSAARTERTINHDPLNEAHEVA